MRVLSLSAIAALTVALTCAGVAPAVAQSSSAGAAHRKVLGYQDPETGIFQPLTRVVPDASTSPTSGTVQVTLDITLKTVLPSKGTILCSGQLLAESLNISTMSETISEWTEQANSVATVNGSMAVCTVKVPYSWLLPSGGTHTLTGSYTVEMNNAAGASPSVIRAASGDFYNSSIPASNTISKFTVYVVL